MFTWTGFYIGANAGYAFDSHHNLYTTGNDVVSAGLLAVGETPTYSRFGSSGFTGGGQIGYNYQFGNGLGFGGGGGGIVVGVEADAAYTDLRRSGSYVGPVFDTLSTASTRTEYVGTVRGRLGVAFDRLLVFGTGGFAYGGVKDRSAGFAPDGTQYFAGGRDSIQTGYAYGGGLEYALPTGSFLNFFQSSAVTIKAEFIHYDLGTSNYTVSSTTAFPLASSFNDRVHVQGNLARAGINYKFGDVAPTPVVARY